MSDPIKDKLEAQARAFVASVMETELQYCYDNCDNDPLTVWDFIADVESGLRRILEEGTDESREAIMANFLRMRGLA